MIYATALPIEKYTVLAANGQHYGLYDSYKDRPALLALIAIASPFCYDYEGCRPEGKRRCTLAEGSEGIFSRTLGALVGGRTVEDLLSSMTPLEFYAYVQGEPLDHLPLVRELLSVSGVDIKPLIGARAAAWGMNYRGKISSKGKVHRLSFGGKDRPLEVPMKLQYAHEAIRRGMMNDAANQ